MAGDSVGRASIDLDVNFSKGSASLKKFQQEIAKTANVAKNLFGPLKTSADAAVKSIDKLTAAQKKLNAALKSSGSGSSKATTKGVSGQSAAEVAKLSAALQRSEAALAKTQQKVNQLAAALLVLQNRFKAMRAASASAESLTPFQQTTNAIIKLRAEVSKLERAKFAPGTKEAIAAERAIARLNAKIRELGGTVDKSGNFINRHAAAINQLAFSAARAGSGFANFLPIIARVSTLLAKHEFGEGGIGGALRSLKEKFTGASAAAEGLGGAGGKAAGAMGALKGALAGVSLGAIAAAAAILLVVAAVGFLAAKLGPLGSALTKAQSSIKLIFEGAGQDMLKFSRDAANAFGITEQAALVFVGKTGQLFKSFGVGAESAGKMSQALLVTADVLRSTSSEFISADDAMQAVFDTVAGNIEGLRRFDIFLTEIGLTQVALRNGIKVTGGAFDNFQRSILAQVAALEQAKLRYEQYQKTMDSTQRQSERLKAAFDDIKAAIGQGLAPILSFVFTIFFGIFDTIRDGVNAIGDFIKQNKGLVEALKNIAEQAIRSVPGLELLVKALEFIHGKGEDALESARKQVDGQKKIDDAIKESIKVLNDYKRELTVSDLEQLVDAHEAVADAIANAARAEKDAVLDLSRAREDAARRRADAERDLAETIEDAEESLFEARKKVRDTEKKNARDIKDAERALKRERLESARRVDDAERNLAEARKKRQQDILDANLSVFEASLKGDVFALNRARLELTRARQSKDVANAQRKLAEEEFDAKQKIKDLERELHETRMDAAAALKEAQRELRLVIEETQEAIDEARRKLHEVEVENNRQLHDAAQALADARREGAESVKDAEKSLDRLNFQLGTTQRTLASILDQLERMKNAFLALEPGIKINPEGGWELPGVGGGNAAGGPVKRGVLGLVGERGPELFIPNQNGQIISNDVLLKLIRAMENGGGRTRGNQTIQVNQVANDPEATAFAVSRRLARGLN